jgi:hypothetical protein
VRVAGDGGTQYEASIPGTNAVNALHAAKHDSNMSGEKSLQELMNVHFSSRALALHLDADPAMLYFVYNQSAIAVLVAHDIQTGVMRCVLC